MKERKKKYRLRQIAIQSLNELILANYKAALHKENISYFATKKKLDLKSAALSTKQKILITKVAKVNLFRKRKAKIKNMLNNNFICYCLSILQKNKIIILYDKRIETTNCITTRIPFLAMFTFVDHPTLYRLDPTNLNENFELAKNLANNTYVPIIQKNGIKDLAGNKLSSLDYEIFDHKKVLPFPKEKIPKIFPNTKYINCQLSYLERIKMVELQLKKNKAIYESTIQLLKVKYGKVYNFTKPKVWIVKNQEKTYQYLGELSKI